MSTQLSNGQSLLEKVISLNLPVSDFAVFGSGPLYIRGIKKTLNDVDIIARGGAWDKAKQLGKVVKTEYREDVINLYENKIQIFNSWSPGMWDIDYLIETATVFDSSGIKFVSLENVLEWKFLMDRPKDFRHIELILEYTDRMFID